MALGAGGRGKAVRRARAMVVRGTVGVGDGVRRRVADMEAGGKMYTRGGRTYWIDGTRRGGL